MSKRLTLVAVGFCLLLAGTAVYLWTNQPYWEVQWRIEQAQTEMDVRREFGEPNYVFFRGAEDYYISGYSYQPREITGRVEVYFPRLPEDKHVDIILYVYYDSSGKVEGYFVGGS
jgi:hypothetical protein